MKTIKLRDILPKDLAPRIARARLRKAFEERDVPLPKRMSGDWEFPAKDQSKVLRIIQK